MHPILFTVFGFSVRAYGVMISLGVVFGLLLAQRVARRLGRYVDDLYDFILYAFVAALAGARLWEVAFSWGYYGKHLAEIPAVWNGGLSIQGAVLGGAVAAYVFARKRHLNFWELADVTAPGLALGQAVGRIGCLLNGDAYGKPTGSWFGVVYAPGTPAYEVFGPQRLWPAESFEGLWDLAIMGLLLYLWGRRFRQGEESPADGRFFLAYLGLYSFGRFLLEFLRADSLMVGGLKAAQITSLAGIALAVGLNWWLRRRSRPHGPETLIDKGLHHG